MALECTVVGMGLIRVDRVVCSAVMMGSDEVALHSEEERSDEELGGQHVMQLSNEQGDYTSSEDEVESSDEEVQERAKARDKRQEAKFEEWGRLGGRQKYHGTDVEANNEKFEDFEFTYG